VPHAEKAKVFKIIQPREFGKSLFLFGKKKDLREKEKPYERSS